MVAMLFLLLHSRQFLGHLKDFANHSTELGFKLVTTLMLNTKLIFLMMLLIAYVNLPQSLGVRFVSV
jgi:hypothetical protein